MKQTDVNLLESEQFVPLEKSGDQIVTVPNLMPQHVVYQIAGLLDFRNGQ